MRPLLARTFVCVLVLPVLLFVHTTAQAQIPSSLINEGDPLPAAGVGHVVSSIGNTAVNHVGGFAATINSSDGTALSHIWGDPAGVAGSILRTEGVFGMLVQTSFESFYGMSDSGQLCYSASGTGGPVDGFDSVWRDDTSIAVEGDPHPTLPNQFWRFGSRPGITAGGTPYFVGGITDTQGGTTQNRGLFSDATGSTVELLGGDNVANLPFPLDTSSTVAFDYRFSADGTHYIAEVQMDGGTTSTDGAMVVDGAGLMIAGGLVREGSPLPAAAGGLPGENWDNFDFTGYTESGDWFFTGDSDGATATDEFILKNGTIMVREGDIWGGATVSGAIEGAYMNEDGDLAFIWDVDGGSLEALFLNDVLLLVEGDEVDWDGDGVVDAGFTVDAFTGISSLTLGDRDNTGTATVYFTADVVSPTGDVLEGYFCMPVALGPTPVQMASFAANASSDEPAVLLEWRTSFEADHAGFKVYRSTKEVSGYERLDSPGLVTGTRDYRYLDDTVAPRTTYYYEIVAVDIRGGQERFGPVRVSTPVWGLRTVLGANHPNPVRAGTTFQFTLAEAGPARLAIYDVAGRLVETIVDAQLPSGEHAFAWDRDGASARGAAAGVFFYRLDAGTFSATRKLVVLPSQ